MPLNIIRFIIPRIFELPVDFEGETVRYQQRGILLKRRETSSPRILSTAMIVGRGLSPRRRGSGRLKSTAREGNSEW